MAIFVNRGVRPSELNIYKMDPEVSPPIAINHQTLSSVDYFGNFGATCENYKEKEGFRLQCSSNSPFACANRNIALGGIKKNAFQLVIYNSINDSGTKRITSALFNSLGETFDIGLLNNKFFDNTYSLNPLTDQKRNLDTFATNVEQFTPTIQHVQNENMFLLCLSGKSFKKNTLIKGLKIFQFSG